MFILLFICYVLLAIDIMSYLSFLYGDMLSKKFRMAVSSGLLVAEYKKAQTPCSGQLT